VQSVLSFAYPGKFETVETATRKLVLPLRDLVFQMTAVTLRSCDAELKAAVRALKADMHTVLATAELSHALSHECVVDNDLAAALDSRLFFSVGIHTGPYLLYEGGGLTGTTSS
jgi:hypothetical protein